MNTIKFQSKDAFVAALESRRPFWQAIDAAAQAKHEKQEKAWHAEAQKRLAKALALDYDGLKAHLGKYGSSISLGDSAPQCPALQEHRLDNVLAALAFSQGKTFSVDSSGVWAEAHSLLTHDPNARRTVC